jgi:uncharacterized delta-60 repeat protein
MNRLFPTRDRRNPLLGRKVVQHFLVVATSLVASFTYAAPGDLDTTFSTDGKRTLSFFNESSRAEAVMIRPDGRIVVAGTCNLTPSAFCITQISATGTLDLTFGSQGSGVEVVAINSDSNRVTAAAMQADGKVVVAGYCQEGARYDFCLARFTVGGRLDSSFGSGGKVATDVTANNDFAYALALQPDGKIVVVGQCGSSTFGNFCVVRYHPHGSLDSSFSGNGIQATDIVRDDKANAVAIQPDGKIIVAGACSETSSTSDARGCVVRYTSTGIVDTGFPKTPVLNGGKSSVEAIVLQPDGRFVLIGRCAETIGDDGACMSRYNADGSFDSTMSSLPQPGALFTPRAAILQPDGKIAVASAAFSAGVPRFVLAMYHSDSSLDKGFSGDGFAYADFASTDDYANALALQPDGKLVLAGYCQVPEIGVNTDMCIARFESATKGYRECSLDLDGDGKVLATTDSLIHTRIALGITGNAVTGGITFPANATRDEWGTNTSRDLRKYLITQCGLNLS